MTHRAQDTAEVELRSEPPGDAATTVRRYALLSTADSKVSAPTSTDVDEFGDAQKACAVDIGKKMDVGHVFVMIVHECVRHFRLNEPLIIEQRDPRALHQARVAIRRLRTAFTLFRPAIHKSSLTPFRKELRAFAAPLGDARNLDVFLEAHEHNFSAGDRRKVTEARSKAYERVVETLKSDGPGDLLRRLLEWAASDDWRKRIASAPIGKFAPGRIDVAWRKVKPASSGFHDLDEKHLHGLRISVKKLRYAVDFLAPLYAKKRVGKFASALEDVQDCLGLIHDDTTGRKIAGALNLDRIELTDAHDRARRLKIVSKRFKHLKHVGRFWAN